MNEKRRYQRYTVKKKRDKVTPGKIKIGGKLVQLVNFSSSGLCVISNTSFSRRAVRITADFGDRGEIDLIGKIVRQNKEKNKWRITIDMTEAYKLASLKKV